MSLVKIQDGSVVDANYTLNKLRADNPQTSFPTKVPESTLNSYNVYTVINMPRPQYDAATHRLMSSISNVDGVWKRTWSTVSLEPSLVEENLRAKRNKLLAETDFYALSDVTMSTEMTTYRQALRDITAHENWPNLEEADWPTKP